MPETQAPPRARWSDARAGGALRGGASAGLALGAALLGFALLRRPHVELDGVVPEVYRGIELAQVLTWAAIAAATAIAAARQTTRRGVMLSIWLGAAAVAAGLRELDLHALLNPENIAQLGLSPDHAVHFRLDWWTDRRVSRGLKFAWAGVLLLLPAAILVPFILARYPWVRRLRGYDRFAWLIAAGLGLLATGYVLDDLVGRAFEDLDVSIAEESVELLGAAALLAAAGLLGLRRAPDRP